MDINIVRASIKKSDLKAMAAAQFGDMVKAVVDVSRSVMAVGGDMHSDGESILLDDGSEQANLWGINLYPDLPAGEWIEFDSMINLRPATGNRSRGIEDHPLRDAIRRIVGVLVTD